MELTIRWIQQAVRQFTDAIKYIEGDSSKNAERFEKEILKKIDELLLQPERYQTNKFKINNDGSYKAFEVFSYRISYRLFLKSNTNHSFEAYQNEPSPILALNL
ncbi:MAG: type II toxin-antitoxin system RelE/ParE family toxin [Ginsengibacter sp.]